MALERCLSGLGSASRVLECVLARHPGVTSAVTPDCFRVRTTAADQPPPPGGHPPLRFSSVLPPGHVAVDTLCLSVDPYMRCRLDPQHPQLGEYIESVPLGGVMDGGGVGRVTASSHEDFAAGDIVCAPFLGFPWRTRAMPTA